jgi:hypothetical protein
MSFKKTGKSTTLGTIDPRDQEPKVDVKLEIQPDKSKDKKEHVDGQ